MPERPQPQPSRIIPCPFCDGAGDEAVAGCCWCDHTGRIDTAKHGLSAEDLRTMAATLHGDLARLKH